METGTRREREVSSFLLGCLLGILHGHASYSLSVPSSHAYAMAPNYVQRFAGEHGLDKPIRDPRECLFAKARLLLSKGGISGHRARVYESTAARLNFNRSKWLTGRVSLVVTSPPYLHAQTYAKDAWLRLWLLGYDYRQLGARYIRTASTETYKEEMSPCLREIMGVLKPDAHAFLVAGDVFVTRHRRNMRRRVLVKTAELLAEVAEQLSPVDGFAFRVEEIIDDNIPSKSRYLSAVHKDGNAEWTSDGTGTGIRIDRILHLKKAPKGLQKSVHHL
jgi:site-specific DNA-methyltransferase (adenine-specific)